MNFKYKNCILYVIIFCLGILFIITNKPKNLIEGFSLSNQCPNILIQKGNDIYLYNSKLAKIPGRNPIRFNNLDDYIQYLRWERSQNIRCPVLFLQHTYDAQGNDVYKQRESIFEFNGGDPPISTFGPGNGDSMLLNATRNNPPFNKNLFPGFDPENQYVGLFTPLDKMQSQSNNGVSPSAMDSDWGGVEFTKDLVKDGYYKDNEVKIWVG